MFFEIFFGIIAAVIVLRYPRQIIFTISFLIGVFFSFFSRAPYKIQDSIISINSQINYRRIFRWVIIIIIIVLVGSIASIL